MLTLIMFLGGYYIYTQTQMNTTLYAYSFSVPIENSFFLLVLAYLILLMTFLLYFISQRTRGKESKSLNEKKN
jgi:predicted membrane protein